jgi:hypothetical protein
MELIGGDYGPMARYSDAHIFVALDLLQNCGRMSRKSLMKEMEIGEGSVRGMLKVLREWKFVEVSQTGITITDFGRENLGKFGIRLVDFSDERYAVSSCQQGVIVEGIAQKVTSGMAQRDIAIRCGADGASIFVMRDNRIIFPMSWSVDDNDPELAGRIRATGIREGEALVLVDAKWPSTARIVAAAAGLAMR